MEFRTPVTRACACRLDKGLFALSFSSFLSRTPLLYCWLLCSSFRCAETLFWRWEMSLHPSEKSVCLCCICSRHISPLQTATPLSTRPSMSLACRSTMCHNSSILKTPKQMSFLSGTEASVGRKRQGRWLYIGQQSKSTG